MKNNNYSVHFVLLSENVFVSIMFKLHVVPIKFNHLFCMLLRSYRVGVDVGAGNGISIALCLGRLPFDRFFERMPKPLKAREGEISLSLSLTGVRLLDGIVFIDLQMDRTRGVSRLAVQVSASHRLGREE